MASHVGDTAELVYESVLQEAPNLEAPMQQEELACSTGEVIDAETEPLESCEDNS